MVKIMLDEEHIALLDELIENESIDRIAMPILFLLIIIIVSAFFIYAHLCEEKNKKLRKKWLSTLTDEQLKAIKEEKDLNL